MKIKTLLLLGLSTFMLCPTEAKTMNPETTPVYYCDGGNVPSGYEIIVLRGDLLLNTEPNAIIAGANRNSVYIHFDRSFGNVNVSIYNAAGVLVYNSVADTSVQQTMIIPVTSSVSGTYTVVLDNTNGYAEGDFERN